MFTSLVFLAAFALEAIGSYVSIVGLSALFAANIVVIVLAGCLDFAKIVAVSFLYKHWKGLGILMRTYLTTASVVLMIITSAGAFGFLSGEFQKSIADVGTQAIKIQTLEDEQSRLQKRKEEIDTQIAKLPDNAVRGRRQLMQQFGPEVNRLNERLAIIDKELPILKIENVEKETHAGPILYVAKAFNTTPEEAVTYVILTIIFVFDPLAIALLIAGNYLLALRKEEKVVESKDTMPPDNLWTCRICGEEHGSSYFVERCEASHSDENKVIEKNVADDEVFADMHANKDNFTIEKVAEAFKDVSRPITVDEMELIPQEEALSPEPDCVYCGDDGEHRIGPSQYMDCEACTPALEVAEDPVEETTHVEPAVRKIMIAERDGRDVISLSVPRASLEDVNSKLADIAPDTSSMSTQTLKLRNYYDDKVETREPIIVGGPKS